MFLETGQAQFTHLSHPWQCLPTSERIPVFFKSSPGEASQRPLAEEFRTCLFLSVKDLLRLSNQRTRGLRIQPIRIECGAEIRPTWMESSLNKLLLLNKKKRTRHFGVFVFVGLGSGRCGLRAAEQAIGDQASALALGRTCSRKTAAPSGASRGSSSRGLHGENQESEAGKELEV